MPQSSIRDLVRAIVPAAGPRVRRPWIFGVWVLSFYAVWGALIADPRRFDLMIQNARMAWIMLLGSYVAGSTPMGGGTVAFPILVFGFGEPVALGRDFSFAVQSVGMVSASIFIVAQRQAVEWTFLRGALLGSTLGLPLGLLLLDNRIPAIGVKLVFAIVWGSFGVLQLLRSVQLRQSVLHAANPLRPALRGRGPTRLGVLVGLLASSTIAAATGSGVDMALYVTLVLYYRVDPKVAIPTSVLLMAFTSLLGSAIKSLQGTWQPEVWGSWLAAAPVVVLGAPLGAWITQLIGLRLTMVFVSLLCLLQAICAFYAERTSLGATGLTVLLLSLFAGAAAFHRIHHLGVRNRPAE